MEFALAVDLGKSADAPVFLRIARSISDDIRRGRLTAGMTLPGTRSLASSLGVHRNTVIAAYRELEAEGWVTVDAAKATRVSLALGPLAPSGAETRASGSRTRRTKELAAARPSAPGFDLEPRVPRIEMQPARGSAIALYGGLPDLSLVPSAAMARAYRRALLGPSRNQALGYGDPLGHPRLRIGLAEMVSRVRGVPCAEEEIMVTRGSQMALFLAARAIVSPGDTVAVEAWGYRAAWEALRLAGAKLVPVAVDEEGMRVDAFEALHEKERFRAVYLTPHHQYPTTVMLSQPRRLALLALVRRERIAVLEDDYDHEFHYDGRPVLPLASADAHGTVVYIGTLSKIFAPGVRLGFVVAPEKLVENMAAIRMLCDRQGDLVVEAAMAELLEDGEIERHARRMRRVYARRRDALVAAVEKRFDGALAFRVPPGGMAIWARAEGVDVEAWAESAKERGVLVQTAKRFTFDGRPRPYLRLGFACETESRIRTAIDRLADTCPGRLNRDLRRAAAG